MRRSVQIALTLLTVLLLVKPFDCFGSGQFTAKAADCCKKGKCAPSSNADDCCKGTLPGGKQLVLSKAPHHSAVALDLIAIVAPVIIAPVRVGTTSIEKWEPPGSPPGSRVSLPLLV